MYVRGATAPSGWQAVWSVFAGASSETYVPVFPYSRVTGACPVTTDLILRVNVITTTTTTTAPTPTPTPNTSNNNNDNSNNNNTYVSGIQILNKYECVWLYTHSTFFLTAAPAVVCIVGDSRYQMHVVVTLTRIINSVVTGQAPVTLELSIPPRKTRTNLKVVHAYITADAIHASYKSEIASQPTMCLVHTGA